MDEIMSITADHGVRFNVRILREGDPYGASRALFWEHEDRPGVEFYDTRYVEGFTPLGQFVSRYFVDTILAMAAFGGLHLLTSEPSWKIDGQSMRVVREWLSHETRG